MSVLRSRIRIEQPVQMHDEIAHLGIVDGLLRLGPPCRMGAGVIRIDADDIDILEIPEFDISDPGKLAAEHEMQELLRLSFAAHPWFP